MKISDVIARLQLLRYSHGEVDVVVHDPQFVFSSNLEFVFQGDNEREILSIEYKVTKDHDSSI